MGKSEIIAELDRLSPEELAEVRARLDQLVGNGAASGSAHRPDERAVHLRSPRLANQSQSRDFIKQVKNLSTNA